MKDSQCSQQLLGHLCDLAKPVPSLLSGLSPEGSCRETNENLWKQRVCWTRSHVKGLLKLRT